MWVVRLESVNFLLEWESTQIGEKYCSPEGLATKPFTLHLIHLNSLNEWEGDQLPDISKRNSPLRSSWFVRIFAEEWERHYSPGYLATKKPLRSIRLIQISLPPLRSVPNLISSSPCLLHDDGPKCSADRRWHQQWVFYYCYLEFIYGLLDISRPQDFYDDDDKWDSDDDAQSYARGDRKNNDDDDDIENIDPARVTSQKRSLEPITEESRICMFYLDLSLSYCGFSNWRFLHWYIIF